jgi:hypothetical protein
MKRAAPVDTMPEFEPLTIASSNLMIEANALRAQGEIFESAVKWVEAGRKLAELGTRLLHAGHSHEAAEDVLNSAACFLEAGETPRALEQLRFFKSVEELTGVASEDDHIRQEWTSLQDAAKRLNDLLLETWAEMKHLMRDPRGARRLTQKWIDEALRRFPGVQQFHFYAARKYMNLAERTGDENATRLAIDRLGCAAALHREDPYMAILLVGQLLAAGKWNDAVTHSEAIVSEFPGNADAQSKAGWACLLHASKGHGPRSLLYDAEKYLRQAIALSDQRPTRYLATDYACLVACLMRLNKPKRELDKLIEEALESHPAAAREALMLVGRRNSPAEALKSIDTQELDRDLWNRAEAQFPIPTAA